MRRLGLWMMFVALWALWPRVVFAQDGNGDGARLQPDTSVAMWSAIVGFVMPPIIATLNRRRWSSTVKGVVAFVASMVAAAGTAYFAGDIGNTSDVATAAMFVFVTAIGTYRLWWAPSGIAPKIEGATG